MCNAKRRLKSLILHAALCMCAGAHGRVYVCVGNGLGMLEKPEWLIRNTAAVAVEVQK